MDCNNKEYNEVVQKIYNERKDFIVIGLTGRTGSGCSTVANILNSKFEELSLSFPKNRDFKNNEDRKYRVIYNYTNSNWQEFIIIEMKNIIASFLFECEYGDFINHLKKLNSGNDSRINDFEILLKEIGDLEPTFNYINKELLEIIDEYPNSELNEKVIKIFNTTIPMAQKYLKSIISKYTYFFKVGDDKNKVEKKAQSNLYKYLFQQYGNNIRASGNPYNNVFNQSRIFSIAERTNKLIKAFRVQNKINGRNTLICIDAIRNPYEATFFRDRYSAFYLMSVNTEDQARNKRLSELNKYEINNLDETEYPKKNNLEQSFYHQNIKNCLELADIHIYNPDVISEKHYFLTEQIIKYISLIMHPGLITPTHIERCMQFAYNAKLNSGCISRQVGAVVTDENYSIKSVGWNNAPEGQVACNLRDINTLYSNNDQSSYSEFELNDATFNLYIKSIVTNSKFKISKNKLGGRVYSYCFKDVYNSLKGEKNQVYTRSLHAEENAFMQISKYGGQGLQGGFLFTTASPCELCSKKAYHLGIKKIFYIDPYPGIAQTHILKFTVNSNMNPEMNLFYGAIGEAYTALYSQRISYKDELSLITGIEYEKINTKSDE